MGSEVQSSFCIDLSGVRRNQRSSCLTEDMDEFPLISSTKTNLRCVIVQAHTKHRHKTSFKVHRFQ